MKITGIVCEYNPLHLGHRKQLEAVRQKIGSDGGIVCIMSGNFVQRGAPAIFHKMYRAQAALAAGADLVLELPVTAALSSAEGFAAGAIAMLKPLCDSLCFGAETADAALFLDTARVLLSSEFPEALRDQLEKGLSFPAAREAAVSALGYDSSVLRSPNNILAVEYCKAILSQDAAIEPMPIHRPGSYHAETADASDPSATSIRRLIEQNEPWQAFLPPQVLPCFAEAAVHTLSHGEAYILGRLRTMTETEFAALPYGSEGLWRKLMHASRQYSTLEQILTAVKSKRYTRSRLDRMVMCAALGISAEDLAAPAPYARVLAFNDTGRTLLSHARDSGLYPNIGQKTGHPYETLEHRCGSLYGLFAEKPEPPDSEQRLRVIYNRI